MKRILVSAAVLLAACTTVVATDDGSVARGRPKGKGWTLRDDFWGVVTAVNHSGITIRGARPFRGEAERVQTFPFELGLASATRVPPGGHVNDTVYLPTDVRVGDVVRIEFADDGVEAVCERITIRRRPGGRVPPGYCKGDTLRHHERMNAHQDLEEKDIPLPEKYDDDATMKRGVPGVPKRPSGAHGTTGGASTPRPGFPEPSKVPPPVKP